MLSFIVGLLLVAYGSTVLEYNLGTNFGQIIKDYSVNNNHAVNGLSPTTTANDFFATDRGGYFDGLGTTLRPPSNEIIKEGFSLVGTFGFMSWIVLDDESGMVVLRQEENNENSGFSIYYDADKQAIELGIFLMGFSENSEDSGDYYSDGSDSIGDSDGYDSVVESDQGGSNINDENTENSESEDYFESDSSSNSSDTTEDDFDSTSLISIKRYTNNQAVPKRQWLMLSLEITDKTWKFSINANPVLTYEAPSSYSEPNQMIISIGSSNSGLSSFKGFIWSFILKKNEVDFSMFISSSESSNCLTPSCSESCSPSTIDPQTGAGCLCTELRENYNCGGSSCPSSTTGCSGSTPLTCNCPFNSCKLIKGKSVCDCENGFYGETSCKECNSLCSKCVEAKKCVACKDLNADLAKGCACKSGFSLSDDGKCKKNDVFVDEIFVEFNQSEIVAKTFYEAAVKVLKVSELKSEARVNKKVELFINSIFFSSGKTDKEGYVVFKVFITQPGPAVLRFSSDSVEKEVMVIVIASDNFDPLCGVAKTVSECDVCKVNSVKNGGNCTCIPFSSYNSETSNCDCIEGFKSQSGRCTECLPYLKDTDVSGYFSGDFLSIILNFELEVATSSLSLESCDQLISGPTELLNQTEKCTWISSSVLKVFLTSISKTSKLILNPYNILASGRPCSYRDQKLEINLKETSEKLTPVISISAPETFSLLCSSSSLLISSDFKSTSAVYSWWLTSPDLQDLSAYISLISKDSFEIPRSLLHPTSFEINLKISLQDWETSATGSKTIKISNSGNLNSFLSVPSFNSIQKTQKLVIIAAADFCGKSDSNDSFDFSVLWTGNLPGIQDLVLEGRQNTLVVDGSRLDIGEYDVVATVSSLNDSVTSYTKIKVIPSDLLLSLSRSSGSISASQDFQVTASCSDPDESQGKFRYFWFCMQDKSSCKDLKGQTLEFSINGGSLTIKKEDLKTNASYSLTVKCESNGKSKFQSIDVKVDESVQGEAMVSFPTLKVNPDYLNNLIPIIRYKGSLMFSWKVTGNGFSSKILNSDSFIGFPEFSLKAGSVYNLELHITSDSFQGTLKAFGQLKTNSGPVCKEIVVSHEESLTRLKAEGCYDSDDEDYPLSFQYGFVDSGKKSFWVNEPVSLSSYSLYLPSSVEEAQVRVIDTILTSMVYSKSVSKKTFRLLGEDYLGQAIQQCRNPLNVPNTIITFTQYSIDFSTFSYLFSQFYSYFNNIPSSKFNLDMYLSCLSGLLGKDQMITDEQLLNATKLTLKLINRYELKVFTGTVQSILKLFDGYTDRIDYLILSELFISVAESWVQDTTPNIILEYSNSTCLVKIRRIGYYYVGSSLQNEKVKIEFPNDLGISLDQVFDVLLTVQKIKEGAYINFLLNISGTYENYTFGFVDVRELGMKIDSPIMITIPNFLKANYFKCKDSSLAKGNCAVHKVNKTHIVLGITNKGSYVVKESSADCTLTKTPVLISCSLLVFAFALAFLFYFKDRKNSGQRLFQNDFKRSFNLTSLFIPQENPLRIASTGRIISSLLLIEALIGLTYSSTFEEVMKGSSFIKHTSSFELGRGLVCFGGSFLYDLINTFAFISRKNKRFCVLGVFSSIFVCFLSIVAIFFVCLILCPEEVDSWIVNFAVWGTAQVILIQGILAAVVACLNRDQNYRQTRVTSLTPSEGSKSSPEKSQMNETCMINRELSSTLSSPRIF
jgi:hypothetical protein